MLGAILVGGAHDFISGMLSVREKGTSMGDVIGKYLGKKVRWLMNVVLVVPLILVGVVFVTGPASLLKDDHPRLDDLQLLGGCHLHLLPPCHPPSH
ncbi:MAG: carbon starvation CstA family protein [Betaproteobacteria bacterium]